MKIDFNQPILDFDGDVINGKDADDKDYPLLLRNVCVNALLSDFPIQSKQPVSGTEKVDRFELARVIHKCEGTLDITTEQIVKIKKLITLCFKTIVVGQTHKMLEKENGN